MLKFDANITFMFRELPILERFVAAKKAGFSGVEILSPEDASPQSIAEAVRQAEIEVVLCNAHMGDFIQGGLGLSAVPGREKEFSNAIELARKMAKQFDCPRIHVGPSRVAEGDDRSRYIDTLVKNLKLASEVLGKAGIEVLVEPLNTVDMPDILLSSVDETLDVIDATGCNNIKLQFDIYHLSQMEADPLAQLEKHIHRIGHIQFADCPGRAEPGTGKIKFNDYFEKLNDLGYQGWVGAEYMPTKQTEETLHWLQKN